MEDQAMKIATMVVVCVAATFNAGAHAVALDDTQTVKVGYGDLNLTTRQGKQALVRRIQRAADLVCGAPDALDLTREASYRNCVTNATNGALSQVKWPQS
jgi:UrcA family protein